MGQELRDQMFISRVLTWNNKWDLIEKTIQANPVFLDPNFPLNDIMVVFEEVMALGKQIKEDIEKYYKDKEYLAGGFNKMLKHHEAAEELYNILKRLQQQKKQETSASSS
jgi:hypothetical protein